MSKQLNGKTKHERILALVNIFFLFLQFFIFNIDCCGLCFGFLGAPTKTQLV